MKIVTENGLFKCSHVGIVINKPSQSLVFIDQKKVLVDSDPEGRTIVGCPLAPPVAKPCTITGPTTVPYSELIQINGRRIVLDNLQGITDGLLGPKVGTYFIAMGESGQNFVEAVK